MNDKLAKMQELQQQQMYHSQQIQARYEANTRVMMQQMANMQTGMKRPDLLTTTGVEQLVIDDEISAYYPEPAEWRWSLASDGRGRLGDDHKQNIRSRMWVYLTSILPKPMWSSLIEIDVKGIHIALRTVNRSNAIKEGTKLRTKLVKLSEKHKPMMAWLDDLWVCMEDLDKLRQPVSTEQVRSRMTRGMQTSKGISRGIQR